MHKFECCYTCSCGNRICWEGCWERVCIENELVTVRITGDGKNFEVVLAQSEWGDFICIPSSNIGFAVGGFSDTVYMEEHLRKGLGPKEAVTIAAALKTMENEHK